MARHYGIPYMGSKQKLVDKIVPYILKRHPGATDFYDPFGGGGSVALYAVRKYASLNVHYNELSTAVGGLMEHLQSGGELPLGWVAPEDFKELRSGDGWYAGFILSVWSFGSSADCSYLYGKNVVDFKHELHKAVVEGADNLAIISAMSNEIIARDYGKQINVNLFIDPKRYKTPYQRRILLGRQIPFIGALQHLSHIERLKQIQGMNGLQRLKVSSGISYDAVPITGIKPIIYCDPPYEGTTEYAEGGFNHEVFYEWVANNQYPVYFSSYKINDKRFKLVRAVKTRSLLNQNARTKQDFNYENLYWNGIE